MPSEIIQGWDNIAKFFPYTASTVKVKHAPKMLRAGFVFKSNLDQPGRYKKAPAVWTFKELIFLYLSTLQSKHGKV